MNALQIIFGLFFLLTLRIGVPMAIHWVANQIVAPESLQS